MDLRKEFTTLAEQRAAIKRGNEKLIAKAVPVPDDLAAANKAKELREVESCHKSATGLHEIDFHLITQADVKPEKMSDGGTWMIMDVSCIHCGRSGAFRVPVTEIDW